MVYPELQAPLPAQQAITVNTNLPTYIYNFYNLDSHWHHTVAANRVLLLEPSFFQKYPVCGHTISFVLKLASNISNIQVYVGEFADLSAVLGPSAIHYKEHPTNRHYMGTQHPRDWMFEEVQAYFPSFFAYWKKCEPHLKTLSPQGDITSAEQL